MKKKWLSNKERVERKNAKKRLATIDDRQSKIDVKQHDTGILLAESQARLLCSREELSTAKAGSTRHDALLVKVKREVIERDLCSKQNEAANHLSSLNRLPRCRILPPEKIEIHHQKIKTHQRSSGLAKPKVGSFHDDFMNQTFEDLMDKNETEQGMTIICLEEFDNPLNEGNVYTIENDEDAYEDAYVPLRKRGKNFSRKSNGKRGGRSSVFADCGEFEGEQQQECYQFALDLQSFYYKSRKCPFAI